MFLLTILFLLTLKHFICDFPLQAFPFQYTNKGTYGHIGGVLHSVIHFVGAFVVLICFIPFELAFLLSVFDGMVHYHVDWAKVNIGKRYNLKPNNSEWFWILLGVDQLLHSLTYFAMVYVIHVKI
jgi:hypothetical protein